MPGLTTMPIIQSAPPANSGAKSLAGTFAAANVPDPQNTSVSASDSRTADTASGSSTGAVSATQAGSAPDSFAGALQRQLAQAGPRDTPAADYRPLADVTLPIQSFSGLVAAQSSQPVSVETLLSDLSNFVDQLSLHGNSPTPVSAESGTSADTQDLAAAGTVPGLILTAAPIDSPEADAGLKPDPTNQKENDTPPEMSLDGLAAVAALMQSMQPNESVKPVVGVAVEEKRSAATATGGLLLTPGLPTPGPAPGLPAPVLTPGLPTPVLANSDTGIEPAHTTASEFLRETAGKSADFAATQATLTAVTPSGTNRGESKEPEGSFDALLAAAQTASQHRNGGVHSQTSTPLPVQAPVGTHGWDGEVADKLVWMVGRQEQRAELVLNPPQMGRIEVSLSMNDGQTSALFVSANPAVRDALEAALPRLREILADAGVNLGQTQVGADTGNNAGNSSTNNAENSDNSRRGLSNNELPTSNETLRQLDTPPWLKRGNGLVDIFA